MLAPQLRALTLLAVALSAGRIARKTGRTLLAVGVSCAVFAGLPYSAG